MFLKRPPDHTIEINIRQVFIEHLLRDLLWYCVFMSSFWNSIGASAALLLRRLAKFTRIEQISIHIPRLRSIPRLILFTISCVHLFFYMANFETYYHGIIDFVWLLWSIEEIVISTRCFRDQIKVKLRNYQTRNRAFTFCCFWWSCEYFTFTTMEFGGTKYVVKTAILR